MKYTVITGASSGIGYEAAKAFAKKKKNLILVARNKEKLQKLKEEILKEHNSLDVVIKNTDLSVIPNVYNLYEEIKDYSIETWINNAGFGDYSIVANQSLEKIENMLRLNIEALTILSTLFVQDYHDVQATQLINISSAGGYVIVPTAVTYCASKFYVSSFTEGLARELKEANSKLKAKVLAPAATKTNFGNTANGISDYDYDKSFGKYHSSEEMAQFLMELYDSDKVVGSVNRETFKFELKDPVFDYAGGAKYNKKV